MMAIKKSFLFLSVFLSGTLLSGFVLGVKDEALSSTAPSSLPPSVTEEYNTTVNPITTTVAPNTTTAAPNTTTAAPSTTTTAPSTTTTAPSTTTTAPNTTTLAPSTSTVPPSPTPPPAATPGTWKITDGNQTCAVFQSAITINLAFIDKNNQTQHYKIFVPGNAKVMNPSCESKSAENLTLVWEGGNMSLNFAVKEKLHYFLDSVESFINTTSYPKLAEQTDSKNFSLSYQAEKDSMALQGNFQFSYECSAPSAIQMNNGSELELNSVKYQAFINDPTGKLSPAQNCVTDSSPDMVPILVAGGLIMLVVLVLIAYIVTRRRSQARGYHSM